MATPATDIYVVELIRMQMKLSLLWGVLASRASSRRRAHTINGP